MTNELATLGNTTELTDIQQMVLDEMEQNESDSFDLQPLKLKMPSGGSLFFTLGDDESFKEFSAYIIVSQKRRAFWPDADQLGKPPLCSSPNGRVGVMNFEDEEQIAAADLLDHKHPAIGNEQQDSYDCRACPLSRYGSSPKGNGQACKAGRLLVLMIDGYSIPATLLLPPTSIKPFDTYATAQRAKNNSYFSCATKISLEKQSNAGGIDYATVKFEHLHEIDDSDLMLRILDAREQYKAFAASMDIEVDEYDAS